METKAKRVCLQFFRGFVQFKRRLERRALAFRGRSALGAFAPAGSPLDSLFPQESRTPAPINFVLTFI